MKYAELSEKAKERARDQWREGGNNDDWWDDVYARTVAAAEPLGISIHNRYNRMVGGERIATPDISFSGFSSQGDGCSFAGSIRISALEACVEAMQAYEYVDEDLLELADEGHKIYQMVLTHQVANRLSTKDATEYEECDTSMVVQTTDRFSSGFHMTLQGPDIPGVIEDAIKKFVDGFADWIYEQLKKEDEHLNSDECIIESILANDADFKEDGNF